MLRKVRSRQQALIQLGLEEAMALSIALQERDWTREKHRAQRAHAVRARQREDRRRVVSARRATLRAEQDAAFDLAQAVDLSIQEAPTPTKTPPPSPPSRVLPSERKERAAFYAELYSRQPRPRAAEQ